MRYRLATLLLPLLASCSNHDAGNGAAPATLASTGQVSVKASAPVTHYAAARFADQVSFGATPALVAEIEKLGFEAWIDAQFALPVTPHDASPVAHFNDQVRAEADAANVYFEKATLEAMLARPDQLRQRVVWALSQWIVVSNGKVQQYATLLWQNLLNDHAFGNYGELLRATSTSPPMGVYLDNLSNRPKSDECPWCAPNENYSRELLQLFALGVVKLNQDGSTQRDASKRPLETYTQQDVEAMTRAMTGWQMAKSTPKGDYTSYDGVLIPETWAPAHDREAKTLLGTTLPAGQDTRQDMEAAIAVLMAHQNIAPFVSLRLIQHLVTSNPTPAYISRVATVFRDNGKGVAGDMQAVLKAVLLDGEARKGDTLGADSLSFGKMREPVLWYTGLLRGMACSTPLRWDATPEYPIAGVSRPSIQGPFNQSSVFSFYLPTDRAPGSNLLAPEQRLLNAEELAGRIGGYGLGTASRLSAAGCQADPFGKALTASPRAFIDLVSERYFRGAMPQTLRQNLQELAASVYGATPNERAMTLLQYALATPYYGVIR
ncbi:DUF1800 domain-containing protein [Pseudoduganella sp. LjRoot289]|uniref:DUF1800 domain-containing protein n=1 Tax=Pseudoduganella sp. LjRoot289 TaxID=3342314 RepID=UPI003ECD9AFB